MKKYRFIYLIVVICLFFSFVILKQNNNVVKNVMTNKKYDMKNYMLYENKLIEVDYQTTLTKKSDRLVEALSYLKEDVGVFDSLLLESSMIDKVVIKDEKCKYYFSSLDYDEEKELRLLESLIYLGTQFNDINEIEIYIDNHKIDKMPKKQTVLMNLNRSFGINHLNANHLFLHDYESSIIYYEISIKNEKYIQLESINMKNSNDLDEYLDNILKSYNQGKAVSVFSIEKVYKTKSCELVDDTLHLYLNKNILNDKKAVKKKLIKFLKLDFSQFKQIEYLQIHVDDKVINVDGKNKISLR